MMNIEFRSDFTNSGRGFHLKYETRESISSVARIKVPLLNESGVLTHLPLVLTDIYPVSKFFMEIFFLYNDSSSNKLIRVDSICKLSRMR